MTTENQAPEGGRDEAWLAMAHRIAWRYKKSNDPAHSDTYTFNRDTLLQFARGVVATLAKFDSSSPAEGDAGLREAFVRWSFMTNNIPGSDAQARFIAGDNSAFHHERMAEWHAFQAGAQHQPKGADLTDDQIRAAEATVWQPQWLDDTERADNTKFARAVIAAYRATQAPAPAPQFDEHLRRQVKVVLEGWTLPFDARKVLEAALYATPFPAPAVGAVPFAWYVDDEDGDREYNGSPRMSNGRTGKPLYTAPQVPVEVVDVYEALFGASSLVTTNHVTAAAHLGNGRGNLLLQYADDGAADRACSALWALERIAKSLAASQPPVQSTEGA